MRLVYGYDQLLPSRGADAEQVFNNVAALSRRGVHIDVLVPRPPGAPLDEAALKAHYDVTGPFHVEGVSWGGGGPVLRKAGHALRVVRDPRARAATAVYTRHLPVAFAAIAHGLPTIYETYRPWPDQHRALRPALRRLMTHPRFVGAIVHSRHTARSFLELGVPEDRVAVLYNGYDPARMEPRLSIEAARAAIGLDVRGPVATYAGRVDLEKGLDAVLALARAVPEVTVVIVGSRGDGPVERLAAAIPNVRVVGWQPYDVTVKYLYASDVLLLPTSLDPLQRHGNTVLPMKIFQYLATGRMILGPRAPDVMEVLRDEENAVLVTPGDPQAEATALRRALNEPGLREKVVAGALADARDLTWDARAGRILEFVERRLAAMR